MPCNTVKLPGGYTAIVCTGRRGGASRMCSCQRIATLVCDWPLEAGGTCDKNICTGCRRVVRGLDICPFHRGDPPLTQAEQDAAGACEAANAARMLGLES